MQSSIQSNAKTREEIATEYGIHVRTLYRWLKKAEIILKGGRVTITEQEIIYKEFGDPRPKPIKKP